jgi:hypothetical protein
LGCSFQSGPSLSKTSGMVEWPAAAATVEAAAAALEAAAAAACW